MMMLRADMHVHTCYSSRNDNIAFLGARDCYSTPQQVYAAAKARGMDLVAITDHDTIGGALALVDATNDSPDVIVGEEVSCWFTDGPVQVHLGVYGMTERLHQDLQPLRRNVFDVVECLREAGVVFCLNHLMHFWRQQVPLDRYLRLLSLVPALEVRPGPGPRLRADAAGGRGDVPATAVGGRGAPRPPRGAARGPPRGPTAPGAR